MSVGSCSPSPSETSPRVSRTEDNASMQSEATSSPFTSAYPPSSHANIPHHLPPQIPFQDHAQTEPIIYPSPETQAARLRLDERISQTVRRYPELYDKSMEAFKDKLAKERTWDLVAADLGFENGKEAERSFSKLRKCYTTAKNNLKKCFKMGQMSKGEYTIKLEEVRAQNKHMVWLDPFIKERVRKPAAMLPPGMSYSGSQESRYMQNSAEQDPVGGDSRSASPKSMVSSKVASLPHTPWPRHPLPSITNPPTLQSSVPLPSRSLKEESAISPITAVHKVHSPGAYHIGKPDDSYYTATMLPSSSLHFPEGSPTFYKSSSFAPYPPHSTPHSSAKQASASPHSSGSHRSEALTRMTDFERNIGYAATYPFPPTISSIDHRSLSRSDSSMPRDDEALFAELVASQLRQMTVEQKIQAKFEINQIMYKILLSNFSAARFRPEGIRNPFEPPPMKHMRLSRGDPEYESAHALIAHAQRAISNEVGHRNGSLSAKSRDKSREASRSPQDGSIHSE